MHIRNIEDENEFRSDQSVTRFDVPTRPQNHAQLLKLMINHASVNPYREVGGVFLTGQAGSIIQAVAEEGDKFSIRVPTPSPDELKKNIDWDIYVKYHSHPIDGKLSFTTPDYKNWNYVLRLLESYLTRGNADQSRISVYNYLVMADGAHRLLSCGLSVINLLK